ncbi:GspH/FimT family pseudopilin, partial [Accumulibacter sp.]|uniref:pilus assembly FimT family protein n=1 Tax=Accumulibacter sp. TaxID=2053492 RepID=UPI002590FA5D
MKPGRGFSLVELLVGMAILGVLLAIAMPAFSNWLRNARVRTAAESVQNGLQLARAEAVRRNTSVRFQLVTTLDESCVSDPAGP